MFVIPVAAPPLEPPGALAVGDVTGHGVPAALLMALTVTLLRAEARRAVSPAGADRPCRRATVGAVRGNAG